MASKYTSQQPDTAARGTRAPISWWSWRPGIRPRSAMLIGWPIAFVALLMLCVGLFTLLLGILDTNAPPRRVPGTVVSHGSNILGQLYIDIRLHAPDFPSVVALTVTQTQSRMIHNSDGVFADYSPHLQVLYALEDGEQVYLLPGASVTDSMFGAAALLLFGLLLFPYPAILASWGWRDLLAESGKLGERSRAKARVAGLRAASQGLGSSMRRPGLTSRFSRSSWCGVALVPFDTALDERQRLVTFSISRETCERLHEGDVVEIVYAPHLHYVYRLERVATDE
ncbi:MAG: hypothetical protein WCD86_18740 [Ktedonobacteraceae bacterium]